MQTSSTITNAEFDKILEETIKSVTDKVVLQEINQKKYILNKLEEFNNQIESILEKSKMNSIFEFSVVGLSLINRKDMEKYKDCKNKCDNLETKFLFHGTSTEISSLIITTDFRSGDAAFFGPGIYMTDMLDYAGFYSHQPEINSDKFINHGRIRRKKKHFLLLQVKYFTIERNLNKLIIKLIIQFH